MKTRIFSILAIAALAITVTSCKKDKEDPVITFNAPENHATHTLGGTIEVKATLTDDRGLASYHAHIAEESGGGHAHDFDHHDSGTMSGESYEFSNTVTVPDSLEHHAYFFILEVTDAEGKTTTDELMMHF